MLKLTNKDWYVSLHVCVCVDFKDGCWSLKVTRFPLECVLRPAAGVRANYVKRNAWVCVCVCVRLETFTRCNERL